VLARQQQKLVSVRLENVEDDVLFGCEGIQRRSHSWTGISCKVSYNNTVGPTGHRPLSALQQTQPLDIDIRELCCGTRDFDTYPSDEDAAMAFAEYLKLFQPLYHPQSTNDRAKVDGSVLAQALQRIGPAHLNFCGAYWTVEAAGLMSRLFDVSRLTALILQDCKFTGHILRALLHHGSLSLRTLVVVSDGEDVRTPESGAAFQGTCNGLLMSLTGLHTLVYSVDSCALPRVRLGGPLCIMKRRSGL